MAKKVLNLFPYYGGKVRMAEFISGIMEYCGVDTYIEPFGGAGTVLLNKAPHKLEIYNDSSAGLCSIFELLSNEEDGKKLINYLYENTEYTEECFQDAIDYRNFNEDCFLQELIREMKLIIKKIKGRGITIEDSSFKKSLKEDAGYNTNFKELFCDEKDRYIEGLEEAEKKHIESCQRKLEILQKAFKNKIDSGEYIDNLQSELEKLFAELIEEIERISVENNITYDFKKIENSKKVKKYVMDAKRQITKEQFMNCAVNNRNSYDRIELAAATYVIYQMSWNGMGTIFGSEIFKSDIEYKDTILKLYPIMERVEGIDVNHVDAFAFFHDNKHGWFNYKDDDTILMYCDPTYLKEGEKENVKFNTLDEIIEYAIKTRKEYNPGNVYKHYWTREMHEYFLKNIEYAKCKMIISNYRDKTCLYDKYLNSEAGKTWKSFEWETTTTVSISDGASTSRTEVIWYNF